MSGKAVRETLGFLAVVAGLVFVGLEVRQNTTAVESASRQALGEQVTQIRIAMLSDDQITDLIRRLRLGALPTDLTELEDQKARIIYVTFLSVIQSAYQQVSLGVLDASVYAELPRSIWDYSYADASWPDLRATLDPSFAAFMEREFIR